MCVSTRMWCSWCSRSNIWRNVIYQRLASSHKLTCVRLTKLIRCYIHVQYEKTLTCEMDLQKLPSFTFQLFVSRGRTGSIRGTGREVFEGVEKSVHSPIRSATLSSSSFHFHLFCLLLYRVHDALNRSRDSWSVVRRFILVIFFLFLTYVPFERAIFLL